MKKRFFALAGAILISGAAVVGCGFYLKYKVLKPLGLAQDQNAVALPFLLVADPGLRRSIQLASADAADPAISTTEATESRVTTAPTDPLETTSATEPEETVPPTTEPPETNPPTTEPPAATEPPETTSPTSAPQDTVPPTTTPPQALDTSWQNSGISVDAGWYDDVLFIGNSRTCGLRDYGRKGNADYFCTVGMSVFNYDEQQTSDNGFSKQSLDSLLASKTYGKVFIGLGINECGYPFSSLMSEYKSLVDSVRKAQPDAVIILEGIMTVGEKKAASASYFQLSNLFYINDGIKALADNQTIFYIDVNELFADERGYLIEGISEDGCHPYAKYYMLWSDWISYAAARLGL